MKTKKELSELLLEKRASLDLCLLRPKSRPRYIRYIYIYIYIYIYTYTKTNQNENIIFTLFNFNTRGLCYMDLFKLYDTF